jgi:site-specific DNA-methyltransferase (adenine-specific)
MSNPAVRLFNGDCLNVLKTLDAGSIDAVVADPPYGKRFHDGGVGGAVSDKWPSLAPSRFQGRKIHGDEKPSTGVCQELFRVLKDGSAAYVFSQWMTETAWIDAIRDAGFAVRNRIIWAKPFKGAGDLKTTFGPQHESIIYASKGRHELAGKREGDVWFEPVGPDGCFRKGKVHPNQKPVDLISWLLSKSAAEGMTVLDPFMGSGSTGVACARAGIDFIGCEIDPTYFAVAERRIADASNTLPLAG